MTSATRGKQEGLSDREGMKRIFGSEGRKKGASRKGCKRGEGKQGGPGGTTTMTEGGATRLKSGGTSGTRPTSEGWCEATCECKGEVAMHPEGIVKAKRDSSGTSRSRGRTGRLECRWMTRCGGRVSFSCRKGKGDRFGQRLKTRGEGDQPPASNRIRDSLRAPCVSPSPQQHVKAGVRPRDVDERCRCSGVQCGVTSRPLA
jgi:hypothetical protein